METIVVGSAFIVMGVSGCGKSTVAEALAHRIGGEYLDGDAFHPAANVEKMRSGIPLDDDDRKGWLDTLAKELLQRAHRQQPTVLACSALKEAYRRVLRVHPRVSFVYLKGTYEVIDARMRARAGHFMNPNLLTSQFAALEEPLSGPGTDTVAVHVELSVDAIVDGVLKAAPSLVSQHPSKEFS